MSMASGKGEKLDASQVVQGLKVEGWEDVETKREYLLQHTSLRIRHAVQPDIGQILLHCRDNATAVKVIVDVQPLAYREPHRDPAPQFPVPEGVRSQSQQLP